MKLGYTVDGVDDAGLMAGRNWPPVTANSLMRKVSRVARRIRSDGLCLFVSTPLGRCVCVYVYRLRAINKIQGGEMSRYD